MGAMVAMDNRDYPQAAQLFREVVNQAPAFSPALRRLVHLSEAMSLAAKMGEPRQFLQRLSFGGKFGDFVSFTPGSGHGAQALCGLVPTPAA
jgi:hypothetical protein